jgi:hypothetical protein
MAGDNELSNEERARLQAQDRKRRDKQNTKNATGRGKKPGVGSEKWAKDQGKK